MPRPSPQRRCPDRDSVLVPITRFGRGPANGITGAAVAFYADEPVRRSTFLEMFPESGPVRATRCGACDRIFLHAEPGPTS